MIAAIKLLFNQVIFILLTTSISISISVVTPISSSRTYNLIKSKRIPQHCSKNKNRSTSVLYNTKPTPNPNNEDTTSSRSDFIKTSILTLVTASTISSRPVSVTAASTVTKDTIPFKSPQVAPSSASITSQSSPISPSSSTYEDAITGFISGATIVVAKTILKFPLDTATIRLQMPKNDTTDLTPNIQELFQDSYRGVLAPLIGNIPAGAVFFAIKDTVKSILIHSDADLPTWLITVIAVAIAQPPYWLIRNPTEVVKTRQQAKLEGYDQITASQAYQRTWEEAKTSSVQQPPIFIFYSGYLENLLYAYPADLIKFIIYEVFFSNPNALLPNTPLQGAAYGAFSTAIAQLITTPLDVVRNRIMAGTTTGNNTNTTENKLSYWETLAKIAREEGVQGLFSGYVPRVGKAFLSGAIQFAAYEETKVSMNSFFKSRK